MGQGSWASIREVVWQLLYFDSQNFLTLSSNEVASKHVQINLQKWMEEEGSREGRKAREAKVPELI